MSDNNPEQPNPEQPQNAFNPFTALLTAIKDQVYQEQQFYKMVFLVRTDVKMTAGKMCAQCGHAVSEALEEDNPKIKIWKHIGQKKVALKVNFAELKESLKKAEEMKIPCGYIQDAGHTQVDPGTVTVGWIGPWEDDIINQITGQFKLL
ncbi:Peptidyl-tRNA_hydrolase [Hexamita inflata]